MARTKGAKGKPYPGTNISARVLARETDYIRSDGTLDFGKVYLTDRTAAAPVNSVTDIRTFAAIAGEEAQDAPYSVDHFVRAVLPAMKQMGICHTFEVRTDGGKLLGHITDVASAKWAGTEYGRRAAERQLAGVAPSAGPRLLPPVRNPVHARPHMEITIGTQQDPATQKHYFIVYNRVGGVEHQSDPVYDDGELAMEAGGLWADKHWSR